MAECCPRIEILSTNTTNTTNNTNVANRPTAEGDVSCGPPAGGIIWAFVSFVLFVDSSSSDVAWYARYLGSGCAVGPRSSRRAHVRSLTFLAHRGKHFERKVGARRFAAAWAGGGGKPARRRPRLRERGTSPLGRLTPSEQIGIVGEISSAPARLLSSFRTIAAKSAPPSFAMASRSGLAASAWPCPALDFRIGEGAGRTQ